MRQYTQDALDALIACRKAVVDPPRKEMKSERGCRRNDMTLRSEDGQHDFTVFMRVNEDFPENFSIGLDYVPREEPGSLSLVRCNGPHGQTVDEFDASRPHFSPHIHKALEANISRGIRPEKGAVMTREYASFEQALPYFLRLINVAGASEILPQHQQMDLFSKEGGL